VIKMKRLLPIIFILLLAINVNADGCYFPPPNHGQLYEPTQEAVIVFNGHHETLIIKPSFSGEASEFAWVVPVPAYPTVEKSDRELFYELDRLTSPVRYGPAPMGLTFSGEAKASDVGIYLHERKQVGIYDTVIMSGWDENNFVWWFQKEGFNIPDSARPIIKGYMDKHWAFVVMKINSSDFDGEIQPAQFGFDTPEAVYPLRISSVNKGASKITLYAFAESRMQEDGFNVTYAKQLDAKDLLYDYPKLNQLLDRGYFLTRMERTMWPAEMSYDIALAKDTTTNPWTGKEESQEYVPRREAPFDWDMFFFVNLAAAAVLAIAALAFRFVFNHFNRKSPIGVKRVLAYGAVLLVILDIVIYYDQLGSAAASIPALLSGWLLPVVWLATMIFVPLVFLGAIFYAVHLAATKLYK